MSNDVPVMPAAFIGKKLLNAKLPVEEPVAVVNANTT